MTARDNLLAAFRDRRDPDIRDTLATIDTEAELASFTAGLKLRGAYDDNAAHEIEVRRFQLQKAKGVSWRA